MVFESSEARQSKMRDRSFQTRVRSLSKSKQVSSLQMLEILQTLQAPFVEPLNLVRGREIKA